MSKCSHSGQPPLLTEVDAELVREQLLGRVDESAVLDELPRLEINYDPARAPEAGSKVVEGHWHVDSSATLIGREGPGRPNTAAPGSSHASW
jgi:hypothetical protein